VSPARRRFLAALACASFPAPTLAQGATRRLGILALGDRASSAGLWAPMLQALAPRGFREGAGLNVEWRCAEGAAGRLPALAKELVATRPDVLVTLGTLATRALQSATSRVPIVTAAVADPVLGGFAHSLSRPGKNVTGLSLGGGEIATLQVALLKATAPKVVRVLILRGDGDWNENEVVAPMAAAGRSAGLGVDVLQSPTEASLDRAFREQRGAATTAAFIYQVDPPIARVATDLALRHRVATMFEDRAWVTEGGLMSYVMFHEDRMRRIAAILGNVLRGADPASIPFELPTNSHFALNRRTAATLGLALPADIVARADEVFD